MTTDQVFTVAETAKILKTTPKTVYRLLLRGKLKSISCLRHKRVTADSLRELIGVQE